MRGDTGGDTGIKVCPLVPLPWAQLRHAGTVLPVGRADSLMVTIEIKFADRCNPLGREAETTVPSRKRVLGSETQERTLGTKSKPTSAPRSRC